MTSVQNSQLVETYDIDLELIEQMHDDRRIYFNGYKPWHDNYLVMNITGYFGLAPDKPMICTVWPFYDIAQDDATSRQIYSLKHQQFIGNEYEVWHVI